MEGRRDEGGSSWKDRGARRFEEAWDSGGSSDELHWVAAEGQDGLRGPEVAEREEEICLQPEPAWDALLRFRDPLVELEFLKHYNQSSIAFDILNFSSMVVLGGAFSLCLTASTGINRGINIFLGCMGLTSVRLALIAWHRDWYTQQRTHLLKFMHVVHCLIVLVSSWTIPFPYFNQPSFLLMYLMRTPIMILLMVGCGMAIPFKVHIFSQLAACLVSSPWVAILCNRCTDPGARYSVHVSDGFFMGVSQGISHWMQRLSIIGAIDEAFGVHWKTPDVASPCWAPMLFVHFFLGYLIPCTVVYCSEVYRRLWFLASRSSGFPSVSARQELKGSLGLATLALLVFSQCFWIALTSIYTSAPSMQRSQQEI